MNILGETPGSKANISHLQTGMAFPCSERAAVVLAQVRTVLDLSCHRAPQNMSIWPSAPWRSAGVSSPPSPSCADPLKLLPHLQPRVMLRKHKHLLRQDVGQVFPAQDGGVARAAEDCSCEVFGFDPRY
jgi:hypothetical protein